VAGISSDSARFAVHMKRVAADAIWNR
jgi:hypothetical protein